MKFKWNKGVAENRVDRAKKRLIAVGMMISRSAKQYCVVDTGRLRASISVNWTGSGKVRGKTTPIMGSGAHKVSNEYGRQMQAVDTTDDGIGPPAEALLFQVVVGTNVRYAPFIEFGTSKMGNTPFLRPGFEENRTFLERGSIMTADFGEEKGEIEI